LWCQGRASGIHESSRIFLILEKSPFHIFFDGGEEEKLEIFLFTTIKKYVVISLGWGGGLFDELFKSSG